ncbi:response regulator transcription factor [Roseimicrobium sp. ORNL1]|uniref:response regulator n=1 Tax=Roseimicrobium sp. ORNL1 TaxID=2711231 RepID=UPI0023EFAB34|nr:response regulator transcription factor [Roseimicrobium sp. ORNL1]
MLPPGTTASPSVTAQPSSRSSAPTRPWRIGVADDHSIMRAVYRTLLEDEPRFTLAWSAATLAEARQQMQADLPDLLIVDINMPDGDGLDFVRETLPQAPDMRVLVISAHEEREYPEMARACGAHGYLCKNSTPTDVLAALDSLRRGEPSF